MDQTAAMALMSLFTQAGRAEPYAHYDGMRASSPVYTVGARRALVTGYPECVDILRDSRTYAVPDRDYADRTWPGWQEHASVASVYGSLMYQNPPENQPARRLLMRFFDRPQVRGMAAMIERLAEVYAGSLASDEPGGAVDATTGLLRLPDAIMGELAGVPDADMGRLVRWLDSMLEANEFNPPGHDLGQADDDAPQLLAYLRRELLVRGRKPGNLIDVLAPLWTEQGEQDLLDTLAFVLGAGTVTTASLLGSALVRLALDPDLLDRIRDDDALLRSFLLETVRYDPPVQYGARIARHDTELHGVRIPQDTMLLVCFGAMGRDPRRFPEADKFRPDRFMAGGEDPRDLMSFGLGVHSCIGTHLALATAEAAFRSVARRYDGLRLASAPERTSRVVVRPFARLEIRCEPRKSVRN